MFASDLLLTLMSASLSVSMAEQGYRLIYTARHHESCHIARSLTQSENQHFVSPSPGDAAAVYHTSHMDSSIALAAMERSMLLIYHRNLSRLCNMLYNI